MGIGVNFGCSRCWEKDCNCYLLDDIEAARKDIAEVGTHASVALKAIEDGKLDFAKNILKMLIRNYK